MKMIKEIQEEPLQEISLNKDIDKNDESSKKKNNNIENKISNITSDIKKLNIQSEVAKSPTNDNILSEQKNKIIKQSPLSSLTSNDFSGNKNITKTPLRQGNFQEKVKYNFQQKSNVGKDKGNDYNSHRNSISMRSPIYSYFDESQKFLSEQYSEENLLGLTGNKNKNKNLSNGELMKKDNNSSNPDIKNTIKPKKKNSYSSINKDAKEEHEVETPNYNDFNFFTDSNMSPEYYNISQLSNGINNLYGNKLSRKLS